MRALKALIKPFEAPQRTEKIKISVNLYINTTSEMSRAGKLNY